MRIRKALALAGAAGVIAVIGLFGSLPAPARAVAPTAASGPTPPSNPVLGLVAPIADPICDAAVLTVFAIPVLEASLKPITEPLLPALGSVISTCAKFPRTAKAVCMLDPIFQTAVTDALTAAGVPIPVVVTPEDVVLNEVIAIDDALPAAARSAALASLASTALACAAPATVAPAKPLTFPPTTTIPVATSPAGSAPPASGLSAPTATGITPTIGSGASTTPLAAGPLPTGIGAPATTPTSGGAATAALGPPASGKSHGFRYPVVWFVPIGLVFGVAALGQLLTD